MCEREIQLEGERKRGYPLYEGGGVTSDMKILRSSAVSVKVDETRNRSALFDGSATCVWSGCITFICHLCLARVDTPANLSNERLAKVWRGSYSSVLGGFWRRSLCYLYLLRVYNLHISARCKSVCDLPLGPGFTSSKGVEPPLKTLM